MGAQFSHFSPDLTLFPPGLQVPLLAVQGKVKCNLHRPEAKKPPNSQRAQLEITTRGLKDEKVPGILAEMFGIILKSPLIGKDEAIMPPEVIY